MARILIIDDTKNIRKMVELTLKSSGHETQIAEDGEVGLAKFGDGVNWDLTIVDQQMPKMEGREFVKAARKIDPQARIMMMTAFATPDLASEIMQLGALDFLRKPFSTEVLRGAVEAALAHEKKSVSNAMANSEIAGEETAGSETAAQNASAVSASAIKGVFPARVSYRANGFSFWPLSQSSTQSSPHGVEGVAHGVAEGLAIGALFQIRQPGGQLAQCFVGVTEHVRQEIERELEPDETKTETFWEDVCGQALLEYFWSRAALPPAVLPVYTLPARLLTQHRSLISWGPFASGR